MIYMTGTFPTPYYAVIFIAQKKLDDDEFDATQGKIAAAIQTQPGFLGMDRHRNSEGLGISISYWDCMESIKQWRSQMTHALAQQGARDKWYSEYVIRTCKVEYDHSFSSEQS